jgi:transcriptional regulator with XRE-family HTH domain
MMLSVTQTTTTPHLRDLRAAADYLQRGLAADAGVSHMAVHRAEHGDRITFTAVARIALALGVTPEDLT